MGVRVLARAPDPSSPRLAVRVLQTHDSACVVFNDHLPEVHHCAAERRLAHNELLAAAVPL